MRETLSPKNLTAKVGLRGGGRGGVPGLGAGAAALAGMRVGAWVRAGVPKEECRNPDGLGGKEKDGGGTSIAAKTPEHPLHRPPTPRISPTPPCVAPQIPAALRPGRARGPAVGTPGGGCIPPAYW